MSDRADFLRSILAAPLPESLEQRAAGEKPCQWSEIDPVISAFMGGHISRDDILRATTAYRRGRALPVDLLKLVRSDG
ncbi:hypothetical protein [Paraburkholderia sp. Cpub6]|uniref:hypothetical protein n=1 Tax=Paraburkholderia sp. Cpub6 TaxID=2723094 RepID=UPI001608C88C|nr:hypothetical protein [Paraburkholderia sp. Cpub6]MBB5463748.1 hypothetical protein [Paraburkholderia sp. Cpub6]